MSETWERVRRRYRLVEEVLADVERDGLDALAAWADPIAAEYGDADGFGEFLADVQRRWQRAFDARLDGVLENGTLADGGRDVDATVAELWRTLAQRHPATRLVLDAHAEHPALATGRARQRMMLKAATGVDLDDLQTEPQQTLRGNHGRKHRAHRGALRLRPICRRVHRGPLPAAGATARVHTGP